MLVDGLREGCGGVVAVRSWLFDDGAIILKLLGETWYARRVGYVLRLVLLYLIGFEVGHLRLNICSNPNHDTR